VVVNVVVLSCVDTSVVGTRTVLNETKVWVTVGPGIVVGTVVETVSVVVRVTSVEISEVM
jgi:hypothetical protein